ncbi:hypothetical protein PPTG_24199 [Phytophthora nicotianae INRA-310]|uniref:Uncharacterized protein n=1 Tax=Phytophthora nicotianae (strain INRA-310) TaxID=761204 RepID=W2PL40_PHYN3|nr:hypothetical protein PPTG_24199 [Phytophthora nicotianae INRA-310]ETN00750.1 hypothetical protein PPTG_24199 [Phytophthora nicotianae INRA-310]
MSSVLTNCRSHRCLANEDGDECYCRYKINTCERGRINVVYNQGVHVMHDIRATSPPRTRLTGPMKTVIEAKLDLSPPASTQQLYAHISSALERNDLNSTAPLKPRSTHSCGAGITLVTTLAKSQKLLTLRCMTSSV